MCRPTVLPWAASIVIEQHERFFRSHRRRDNQRSHFLNGQTTRVVKEGCHHPLSDEDSQVGPVGNCDDLVAHPANLISALASWTEHAVVAPRRREMLALPIPQIRAAFAPLPVPGPSPGLLGARLLPAVPVRTSRDVPP